jgi:uncharacterized metal-binding protein YceD (DUF177 family)
MRRYYQNDSYVLQTLRYEYWTLSVTYHEMLLTPDVRSMIKLKMFVREDICISEPEAQPCETDKQKLKDGHTVLHVILTEQSSSRFL